MLWPQLLTDTLLRLAAGQTYQPRWSADILAELHRNLVPRTGMAAAEQRLYRMQRAFPLAEITGYEHLVESMTNDPKDREQPTTISALADALADRAGLAGFGQAVQRHLDK